MSITGSGGEEREESSLSEYSTAALYAIVLTFSGCEEPYINPLGGGSGGVILKINTYGI